MQAMDALSAHASQRRGYGTYVKTEAEKDAIKRKRSDPPTQLVEEDCTYCGGPLDACGCSAQDPREPMEEEASEGPTAAAPPVAGKGPHYRQIVEDEDSAGALEGEDAPADEADEPDQLDLPDLHQYFQGYPSVSDENVISMCRAYASYLASLSKKKLKSTSGSGKGCVPKRRRRS